MRASLARKLIVSSICWNFCIVLFSAAEPLHAAEPSVVGLWEQVDDKSGQAESWFRITERNGVYEGAIVKIFRKPGKIRTGSATNAKAQNAELRCWGSRRSRACGATGKPTRTALSWNRAVARSNAACSG